MNASETLSALAKRARTVLDRSGDHYDSVKIDSQFLSSLDTLSANVLDDRLVYHIRLPRVRPESGMDTSTRLNGGFHQLNGPTSFEIWNAEPTEFVLSIVRDEQVTFEGLIDAVYPRAELRRRESPAPALGSGDYLAGATLRLSNDYYRQIRNPLGAEPLTCDPYESIISEMNSATGARIFVQVVFESAPENWWWRWYIPLRPKLDPDPEDTLWDRLPLVPRRISCKEIAAEVERERSDEEAVNIISSQEDKPAFEVDIRVFAAAERSRAAERAVSAVASEFEKGYYDPQLDQGLTARPIPVDQIEETFELFIRRGIEQRRVRLGKHKREPCFLTVPEITGIAHIPSSNPNDEFAISNSRIDWRRPRD